MSARPRCVCVEQYGLIYTRLNLCRPVHHGAVVHSVPGFGRAPMSAPLSLQWRVRARELTLVVHDVTRTLQGTFAELCCKSREMV